MNPVQSFNSPKDQKLQSNQKLTQSGLIPGSGAAVGVGIPGIMQPFQLLKYSAISRCGMVLKQIITSSGDKGTKQQAKAVLAPKIN